MTFLEMFAAVAVLVIVTAAALPTGRTIHRRIKEQELKAGVARIRAAIDSYHRDWEEGRIKSDDEAGWPESLEELTEEIEYTPPPEPLVPGPIPGTPGAKPAKPAEKTVKIYLKRIPADPFNSDSSEWDVSGWKARSYGDEPDSTTWGGEGVYDVYSSSEAKALDGSYYKDW